MNQLEYIAVSPARRAAKPRSSVSPIDEQLVAGAILILQRRSQAPTAEAISALLRVTRGVATGHIDRMRWKGYVVARKPLGSGYALTERGLAAVTESDDA